MVLEQAELPVYQLCITNENLLNTEYLTLTLQHADN